MNPVPDAGLRSGSAPIPPLTAHSLPWVDIHAHPGRCFLGRARPVDTVGEPGELDQTARRTADAIRAAGLAAVSYSSVSDLRVIGLNPAGGLTETRPFAPGEAVADHLRQLDRIASISAMCDLPIALTAADVWAAHEQHRASLLLMCEGADFADDDLSLIADAYDRGVRGITIVHYRQNEFGDLQTEPPRYSGLSVKGAALVAEMNRLGMIVDLAHASYETTCQAVAVSADPMMISHTHLRLDDSDHPRLVTEAHASVVARAGGLIGAWPSGVRSVTFKDFVDEVLRLVDLIGVEHVAIGTDMDANYRPVMTEYRQFHDLADSLARHGMTDAEVDRVLGLNALDLFKRVCG